LRHQRLAKLDLGLDVLKSLNCPRQVALIITDGTGHHGHPAPAAVGGCKAHLHPTGRSLTLAQRRLDGHHGGAVVGVNEVAMRNAHEAIAGPPKNLGHGGGDPICEAIHAMRQDHVPRALREEVVLPVALSELRGGDVDRDGHHAVAMGGCVPCEGPLDPVFVNPGHVDVDMKLRVDRLCVGVEDSVSSIRGEHLEHAPAHQVDALLAIEPQGGVVEEHVCQIDNRAEVIAHRGQNEHRVRGPTQVVTHLG